MKRNEIYYKVTRVYRNERNNSKLSVEFNTKEEAEEVFSRCFSQCMRHVSEAENHKISFEYSLTLSKCYKYEIRQQVLKIRTSNPDNAILGIT